MSNPYGETHEYSPEMEYSEAEHYETAGEADLFSEAELMELGEQLLEVTNEAELDQFLSATCSRVRSARSRARWAYRLELSIRSAGS